MLPWMRDQIMEAWQCRKNLGTFERRLLILPSISTRNSDSDNFSVNVISLQGNVLNVAVKPDFTIGRIKGIAMKHFYGQDNSKRTFQYRLVHSSRFKQLEDDSTIEDEEICEYDELLLVEIRRTASKENLTEEALRGPTDEAIAQATSDLPPKNLRQVPPSSDCPTDFQNVIRKILITLVQASARILMHSNEAGEFYDIIKEKLEVRSKPITDPKIVKTLVEMGYTEKKVLKALRLPKSNIMQALEWLIDHQNDLEDEDEEEEESLDTIVEESVESSENTASSSSSTSRTSDELVNEPSQGDKNPRKEKNLVHIVELLLNSLRKDKKLDFKPNAKALESLLEMGFEERSIIGALKVTGNDQANACEWLLGERRRSLQDLDEGLDPENPIYKAIMTNPHIQLSLTNPKLLLAYLSMLETPTSTNIWANDPEVSPILTQIFRTYHSEKHALHVNRYNTNN